MRKPGQGSIQRVVHPVRRLRSERGAYLIVTAIMTPFLLTLSLMAFDLGRVYLMKTYLQSIVDLAALAGMRTYVAEKAIALKEETVLSGNELYAKVYESVEWTVRVNDVNDPALYSDLGPNPGSDDMNPNVQFGIYEPDPDPASRLGVELTKPELMDVIPPVNRFLGLKVALEKPVGGLVRFLGINIKVSAVAVRCSETMVALEGMCPSLCGNGNLDSAEGEECDGGKNNGIPQNCDPPGYVADCSASDRVKECDFCSITCTNEKANIYGPCCGDGSVANGEECDDGTRNADDARCKLNCTLQVPPTCGGTDGKIDFDKGEQCDPSAGSDPSTCVDCLCANGTIFDSNTKLCRGPILTCNEDNVCNPGEKCPECPDCGMTCPEVGCATPEDYSSSGPTGKDPNLA